MKSEKEKEWIEAIKRGESHAVEKAVNLYGRRLLRSAFLLCGREADAHDMVQETFLRAIKSIHRFKGKSTLFTWLYGILLNIFRHQTRKKGYVVFSGDLEEKESSVGSNPEHNLDRERIFSGVYSLIQTLSPRHRVALILRYYEGLKITEIAEIVKASEGTVKSRLHYATEAMRKKMPSNLNVLNRSITNNKETQ